ncbi:hypothetical protein MKW94_015066 [Papaver nudicaule]|uniref:Uncharacterized protein n=1 Tax=Papaver nudicaule TaxID=74823 RepID=A0AA41VGZ7_PAPNU|nr:hypothetical protein [Papaver nudicaule]
MARFVKFVTRKLHDYENGISALAFAASGVMVYYVVDKQNRLEERLDKMQERQETVEKRLSGSSSILSQVNLQRKEREKMVAFLKNNSTADPQF